VLHQVGDGITVEMKSRTREPFPAPVEVFAGGEKLGRLEAGKLEIQFDQPGIAPLFLRTRSADGSVMLSRPNTILVAK